MRQPPRIGRLVKVTSEACSSSSAVLADALSCAAEMQTGMATVGESDHGEGLPPVTSETCPHRPRIPTQ
jgi:hypothetical protein